MDHEENEPKLFSLSEAERARRQVEPLLIDAMEGRRQMGDLEESLSAIANRIQVMGGITLDYDVAARMRADLNQVVAKVKDALDQIQATGCIVKDLDSGLVDFSFVDKGMKRFICQAGCLGEDRIRFYHGQDEGFSGRKAHRSRGHRSAASDPINFKEKQFLLRPRRSSVRGRTIVNEKTEDRLARRCQPVSSLRRASGGGLARVG